MEKSYFRQIAEHFYTTSLAEIDPATIHEVKRALLNYLGGSAYTAAHSYTAPLLETIRSWNTTSGDSNIWGDTVPVSASIATFSNAARLSRIELNDGTRSSAHPGIYVWSVVLAFYQEKPRPISEVIKAVIFGYEVGTRMAMLSIDRIRELGLHNPGFVGGIAAVAAGGMLRGLTIDQLVNAFGIVASLLPVCPFVSFVEGSDVKDLYGGWGTYLACFAITAAANGLTGPETVLDGVKSLNTIFQGEAGKDITFGDPYLINGLSIKEYPACFAVNPAIKAAQLVYAKRKPLLEEIQKINVWSYPYSFDLDQGLPQQLNPTSSRLSLKHTVATVLRKGTVEPCDFTEASLSDPTQQAWKERISVFREDSWGDGTKGIRACRIEVLWTDGSKTIEEFNASEHKHFTSDQELKEKFLFLTHSSWNLDQQESVYKFVLDLEKQPDLNYLLQMLISVPNLSDSR